jgi:uncharacterized membrane protein YoaK (UPF0700 family)
LLLLSATTGLVDAVSVLGLGKVFTANMTGNIVFLAFAVAGAPGFAIAPSLVALLLFLVGAAAGGRIHKASGPTNLRRWAMMTAVAEAALLAAAAAVAIDYDAATLSPAPNHYAAIGFAALAMGLRNATMRQLKAPDLTTTVLTMTLTGIAADSSIAGGTNPNFARRFASVIAIFSGAAVGALMVLHLGIVAPLLLAAGMALIGTLTLVWHGSDQLWSRNGSRQSDRPR